MTSEYSPGGSKPRMTKAQIRRLQKQQKEARKLAEERIAAAKKSDEWKQEQKILQKLEEELQSNTGNLTTDIKHEKKDQRNNKPLSLWQHFILYIKKILSHFQ